MVSMLLHMTVWYAGRMKFILPCIPVIYIEWQIPGVE